MTSFWVTSFFLLVLSFFRDLPPHWCTSTDCCPSEQTSTSSIFEKSTPLRLSFSTASPHSLLYLRPCRKHAFDSGRPDCALEQHKGNMGEIYQTNKQKPRGYVNSRKKIRRCDVWNVTLLCHKSIVLVTYTKYHLLFRNTCL